MTGITNDTGTAYPSGAPIFSLDFLLEFVLLIFFCIVLCPPLLVLFFSVDHYIAHATSNCGTVIET